MIGHDPHVGEAAWPASVERVERDALLATADVVSLHLPLTDETHHLIDATALARMRPGAFLVNVSRGAAGRPAPRCSTRSTPGASAARRSTSSRPSRRRRTTRSCTTRARW